MREVGIVDSFFDEVGRFPFEGFVNFQVAGHFCCTVSGEIDKR